mgnify:FL=1
MKKVCFLSLGSYSLLNSRDNNLDYGGAEVRQVLIGRALAKKGFDICFITYDNAPSRTPSNQTSIVDGISVIKSFCVSTKIPLIKRFAILWKCLKQANSDIYLHSSGFPGIVPLYCLVYRKKFILLISSDRNAVLRNIVSSTSFITKIALYLDIKLSDIVVVQNTFQMHSIEQNFKKTPHLIYNPIKTSELPKLSNTYDKKTVIWIGTIEEIKQPSLLIELAKSLPDYYFKVIGRCSVNEPAVCKWFLSEIESVPNLSYLGFMPQGKLKSVYQEASILINTSIAEGFPNTFLEAWLYGVPVVSLNVDPDEIICKNHLGFHSKTIKQMITDIDTLLKNESLLTDCGRNCQLYVKSIHDLDKIIDDYVVILNCLH